MYLVLTALLALNVSKSILDAFVAIEENIQKGNLTELFRGDEKKAELQETAVDQSNPERARKAKFLMQAIEDIDNITAKRIKEIDELKLDILETIGEDIETVAPENAIIVSRYNAKKNALKPTRMNLAPVNGKDKYDDPMRIMIGEDITNPKGKGLDLWKSLNKFRKELTEKIAASQVVTNESGNIRFDNRYSFKAPEINKFKDQADLNKQILKSMEKSNVHPDDKEQIVEIYRSLTKEVYSKVYDVEGVHWIGKTFDHSPAVAAIASLSSLQKDILSARAAALTLIRSRVGGGEYSFNKIIPLAYGPEVVNANEEFTVEVLMVAYDSDKQPEVIYNGEKVTDIRDGKGYVKLRASGNNLNLSGTVSIRNKSGAKKTLDWTKSVAVMKPSGSIELPDLNVLYRRYQNRVVATASGYDNTILSASPGLTLTRDGDGWIVVPTGTGRQGFLTVSGRSSVTGETVQLKRVEYKINSLPPPLIYCDGAKEGDRIDPRAKKLFARYSPDVPLQKAKFEIKSWTCNVNGAPGRPPSGTTSDISAATALILQARPETLITFECTFIGPGGVLERRLATFKR